MIARPATPSARQWWTFEIEREPVTFDAVDEPVLPQRLATIELLRHDPAREALELADVAGWWQCGVTQVELEVEIGVVDPDGLAESLHPGELLTEPRHLVECRFDIRDDPVEVEAAVVTTQRSGIEER